MKRFFAVCTVFVLMLSFMPSVHTEAVSFTPPFEVNSESAVLYNIDTDTVIYSKNADKQQAPAQLAQIMTAIALKTAMTLKLSFHVLIQYLLNLLNTVKNIRAYLFRWQIWKQMKM